MVGIAKLERHAVKRAIPQNMVGVAKNERHTARDAIPIKPCFFRRATRVERSVELGV